MHKSIYVQQYNTVKKESSYNYIQGFFFAVFYMCTCIGNAGREKDANKLKDQQAVADHRCSSTGIHFRSCPS